MNDNIKTLIAEGNYLMKQMIGKLTELLSEFERRGERHYFDTYALHDKMKKLEDYLGVEWSEKGIAIKGKYKLKK